MTAQLDPSPLGDPERLTFAQGLWFAAGSALLYVLSFWLNRSVIHAYDIFSGVAIFFLPAGVKLVALLVGRHWGALGLLIGNLSLAPLVWPQLSWPMLLLLSLVWVAVVWATVEALLRLMRIPPDLAGLRFSQFLTIDAVAAVLHAFAFNGLLLQMSVRDPAEFMSSVWGMALGDFLGSGAFALMLIGLMALFRRLSSRPSP